MKIFVISFLLAVGAYFVPAEMIDPVARALVPAIALMATGIFPCMTLAIGAMKADGRTPSLIEDLFLKLRSLLQVLVTAFALSVVAIMSLVASLALVSPSAPKGFPISGLPFYVSPAQVATMIAGFTLGLLSGRIIALGRAFFAILNINKKQALLIARSQVRSERDVAMDTARRSRFAQDNPLAKKLTQPNDRDKELTR